MIVTTTPTLQGKEVERYLGIVSGDPVILKSWCKNQKIMANTMTPIAPYM